MKRAFALSLLMFVLSTSLFSQNVKVDQVNEITALSGQEFYFPHFSPDDSKLFVTKSGYKGLYYFDRASNRLVELNQDQGAGYQYKFSESGEFVYFRADEYIGPRKYSKLVQQNIISKKKTLIEADQRGLSTPLNLSNGTILYAKRGEVASKQVETNSAVEAGVADAKGVFIENGKIALYVNGIKKELNPLGDGNYIWPSLSPDENKILFTWAGRGTYVCDLDGKVLAELGYANASEWSPNGDWIVYMEDRDDGHTITSSDIFIVSADGSKKFQVTNTKDKIEMYPSWSNGGNQVAFHTLNGKIFVADLTIE